MAKEIKVPQISEGVETAVISEILVSKGDKIEEDQSVISVETDKATAEVPATSGGTIKEIKVSEGDEVNVGDVIIILEDDDDDEDSEELLRADEEDLVAVLLAGIADQLVLFQRERERLLAEDVLAGHQGLDGQRRAEDIAHKARIFGPVHAKLKLHDNARYHTHGKVDEEELSPELDHLFVDLVPCSHIRRFHDGDQDREAQGEGHEEEVIDRRGGKLQP